MQATPSSKCIRWTYLAIVSSWDIFSYMPRFTCFAATTWYHILFSTWTMVYILCVVHLLGCCELNLFVDKYYPSDSQSVPGKETRCVISSLVCWLLAQPHFSLGSKVVSPIMDRCLTRTKGTGLDSMVLCLLLPKLRLCHMSQNLPSRQYVTALCRGNWIAQVTWIRLNRTIPRESMELFIT